jgi:hypothetical protein
MSASVSKYLSMDWFPLQTALSNAENKFEINFYFYSAKDLIMIAGYEEGACR